MNASVPAPAKTRPAPASAPSKAAFQRASAPSAAAPTYAPVSVDPAIADPGFAHDFGRVRVHSASVAPPSRREPGDPSDGSARSGLVGAGWLMTGARRVGSRADTHASRDAPGPAQGTPAAIPPAPLPGGTGTRPLPSFTLPAPVPVPSLGPAPALAGLARTAPALATIFRLAAGAAPTRSSSPGGSDVQLGSLGPGSRLPGALQRRLESAYGYNLDPVRLHHGPTAARCANALGAAAVTLGDHILLGRHVDPGSPVGGFVLGHETAHVVQGRLHPRSRRGRVSAPGDAAEVEATAAALAALQGRSTRLREGAGEDPQSVAWWLLALIGLGIGALVAGGAAVTGHGVEENRRRRVREERGTVETVLAWVPIAGSVQDIWQAQSNLELALGVGFLALEVATMGGTFVVGRALTRVPGAAYRVLRRGAPAVVEGAVTRGATICVAGEEVAAKALEQAAREFAERGGVVSARTAEIEIESALRRNGAMVFATEGAHAVLYANRAGRVLKVHGGPLIVRITEDMTKFGAERVAQGAVGGGGGRGAMTAYAIVEQGAPLTLAAMERLPAGFQGAMEAVGRTFFGNPTNCGVVQGAAIEASGLSTEAIALLVPPGGVSGRYIPIQLVDHWVTMGSGRLIEGGATRLVYGATSTVTQFTLGFVQVLARTMVPVMGRNAAGRETNPKPPEPGVATAPPLRPRPGVAASGASSGRDAGARSASAGTGTASTAADSLDVRIERAAVDIVDYWSIDPSPVQIEEIRERLPELLAGWLTLSQDSRNALGKSLHGFGMDAAKVVAILA